MAGWHHRLNGHEFEWTLGVGDGQGGLACCDSWGRRVGHSWATELTWTESQGATAIDGIRRGKKNFNTPSSPPRHFEDCIHLAKKYFNSKDYQQKWQQAKGIALWLGSKMPSEKRQRLSGIVSSLWWCDIIAFRKSDSVTRELNATWVLDSVSFS